MDKGTPTVPPVDEGSYHWHGDGIRRRSGTCPVCAAALRKSSSDIPRADRKAILKCLALAKKLKATDTLPPAKGEIARRRLVNAMLRAAGAGRRSRKSSQPRVCSARPLLRSPRARRSRIAVRRRAAAKSRSSGGGDDSGSSSDGPEPPHQVTPLQCARVLCAPTKSTTAHLDHEALADEGVRPRGVRTNPRSSSNSTSALHSACIDSGTKFSTFAAERQYWHMSRPILLIPTHGSHRAPAGQSAIGNRPNLTIKSSALRLRAAVAFTAARNIKDNVFDERPDHQSPGANLMSNNDPATHRKGDALGQRERGRVQRMIERHGLRGAGDLLGVSADTAARCGSGAPVHPSTAKLVRLVLAGIVD